MSGITLAMAEAQLVAYMAAETAVLQGQSYNIGSGTSSRSLTRADLASIQEGIKTWNARVVELSNRASGRGRTRVVVAR